MARLDDDATEATVESTREPDGTLVLRIVGELDVTNRASVEREIEPLLTSDVQRVAFDLSDLSFMDSSGIALLLQIARRVDHVVVRRPSNVIARVIRATGLAEVLPVED